jgi:hypothetical protein
LITADGVGSNGYRLRQWKMELQGVADKAGLAILAASRLRDDRPADRHDDHGQDGSM